MHEAVYNTFSHVVDGNSDGLVSPYEFNTLLVLFGPLHQVSVSESILY